MLRNSEGRTMPTLRKPEETLVAGGVKLLEAPVTIRQTVARDADKCPRRAVLSHRFGLTPKARRYNSNLHTGSVTHAILAAHYTERPDPEQAGIDLYDAEMAHFSALAEDDLEGTFDKALKSLDKDTKLGVAIARMFWKLYPLNRKTHKVVGTEVQLTAEIKLGAVDSVGVTAVLSGTLDVLLEPLTGPVAGGVFVADHKTTARNPHDLVGGLEWAYQTRIYRVLAARNLGRKIAGFIYNFIQKPAIRFCGKDKGVFDNYVNRCWEWFEDEKRDMKPATSFGFMFNEPLVAPEFEQDLRRLGYWMCHDFCHEEEGALNGFPLYLFPRRWADCYKCPFKILCDASTTEWGRIIKAHYTQDFTGYADAEEKGMVLDEFSR